MTQVQAETEVRPVTLKLSVRMTRQEEIGMLTDEQARAIRARHAPAIRGPWDVERRGSISEYIEQSRKDVAALLDDRAELQAEIERLMTRNEELARVVDRYTGTDYMERLHAVARAAQEIVDGLPYRGVRDFPELREELRCVKALEEESHADE